MNLKSMSSAAAIAAVGMFISASSAKADFELTITDVNTAATLSFATSGPVISETLVNPFADFTTISVTGLASNNPSQLNTITASLTGTSNAALTIELSDTDFTTGGNSLVQTLTYTNVLDDATVNGTGYASNTNTDFATDFSTPTIVAPHPVTAASSSTSGLTITPSFSLTQLINVTFGTIGAGENSSANVNATVSVVPEPASVALLGGALLAIGTAVRRRARRV